MPRSKSSFSPRSSNVETIEMVSEDSKTIFYKQSLVWNVKMRFKTYIITGVDACHGGWDEGVGDATGCAQVETRNNSHENSQKCDKIALKNLQNSNGKN